jgi:putative ABC transport system ATP-binding protein
MAKSLISAKNLSRTYHLGEVAVPALKNVTVDIKEGDFVVITGRNGAGKSTLLHNLAVLDHPDGGEVYVHGQAITKLTKRQRLELRLTQLGYIFQEYALIAELTALENVMLPAMMIGPMNASRKRAEELLSVVGLEKHGNHLPSQLSGGEQQKVAIARALINNPEIIFADEPTANLDTTAARDVLKIFQKLNREQKRTVIMVTHEPEETKYANRLIEMSDGKILSDRRQP